MGKVVSNQHTTHSYTARAQPAHGVSWGTHSKQRHAATTTNKLKSVNIDSGHPAHPNVEDSQLPPLTLPVSPRQTFSYCLSVPRAFLFAIIHRTNLRE